MLKISSHSCQILVTLVSNRNTSSPTAVLLFGLLLPLRSDILCLDTGGWEQAPILSHSQLPRWREKIRAIPADLLLSHSHQLSAVKRWLAALSCPVHTLKPENWAHRWGWPRLQGAFPSASTSPCSKPPAPRMAHATEALLDTTEVWEMLPWPWMEENMYCQLRSQMTMNVTRVIEIPAREH